MASIQKVKKIIKELTSQVNQLNHYMEEFDYPPEDDTMYNMTESEALQLAKLLDMIKTTNISFASKKQPDDGGSSEEDEENEEDEEEIPQPDDHYQ